MKGEEMYEEMKGNMFEITAQGGVSQMSAQIDFLANWYMSLFFKNFIQYMVSFTKTIFLNRTLCEEFY